MPTSSADCNILKAWLVSENQHYEAPFSRPDAYLVFGAIQVDCILFAVYMDRVSDSTTHELFHAPGWDTFRPHAFGRYFSDPPPGDDWVGSYVFWVDENENSVLDTGEPSTNVAMPSEFIQQLDFPAEVSISEGVHPSITFSSVSNADRYLLRIFRINESGNPDSSLLLDQSEVIEDDGSPSYCYQYTGDAFQTYGSTLTIAIEAYEDGPCDSVVNRSRYYVQHTVPVTGACCLPDGSCMEAMAIECASAGGTYQGDGIDCASANCSLCFSNSDCGPEFYCAKPEGDCDGEGACTPLPEFCPMVIDEVCGCDGETYMNGCEAAMAGVSIAHLGACDVGTLCSTLGDDPRRYAPDMDVFKFSGSEGETVTVTLESSPPEYGAGQRAVLIIRSLCRGLRLFKRFNDALPLVMTVTLPVTGDYHVKVMEAPGRAVIWGEKYKGDYCLTLEASPYTVATFVPDLDIE